MPIRQLDRAEIRREARELIRTARVSPIKFTLLFLAVSLALSLLDTALTSLTGRIVGVAFVSVSFASILIGLIVIPELKCTLADFRRIITTIVLCLYLFLGITFFNRWINYVCKG